MLICADWRRYVNANMCLTALPVYVSCSLKSIIPIYCRSCRTDSGYVRYDLIFAFRVLPAILLYIINNIMLLKRSIIAKSTVCTDIFNNILHRPLYSLLRTKGVESNEHLLRIRVQAYSMIICLRSLLCNTTALRMWIGLFSTCNVSAHAGLASSLGHCIWTYLLMVFCTLRS